MADYDPSMDEDELAALQDQVDSGPVIPPELSQEAGLPPEVMQQGLPTQAPPNPVSAAVLQSILNRSSHSDENLDVARALRDKEVGQANLAQALGGIGTALGGQGRLKQDTGVFDAIREGAGTRAKEASADEERQRKMVSDAIRQNYLESFRQQGAAQRQAAHKDAVTHNQTMEKIAQKNSDLNEQGKQTQSIQAANRIMSAPALSAEQKKLAAANVILKFIDEVKSGKLVASPSVSKQLTNLLASAELGGQGGVEDRKAIGVDTLYSKLGGLAQYFTGSATDTIPSNILNQIETEATALGSRAAKTFKNNSDSAIAGTDLSDLPGASNDLVNKLAKKRQAALLRANGFDPNTGEPLRSPPAHAFPIKVFNPQLNKSAIVSSEQELSQANAKGFQ